MGENYSRYFIAVSFVYVALGLVLCLLPHTSPEIVAYALAGILIFWGVPRLFRYCIRKEAEPGRMDLAVGLAAILCGVFMLFRPDVPAALMPAVLGAWMLMDALVKLQNGLDLRRLRHRCWVHTLIIAGVLLGMGALLLWDPLAGSPSWRVRVIGLCLIIQGGMNLPVNLWLWKAWKNRQNGRQVPSDTERI